MLAAVYYLFPAYALHLQPVAGTSLPAVRISSAATRASAPQMQQETGPFAGLQNAFAVFQASKQEGMDFKQSVADAIAGDYDRDSVTADVKEAASSAPLALKLIGETGASPKVVRLDDPWDKGNVMRAALGRLTGKSSVPSIWVGGEYIGGCDDGPSDEAPGLVPMAFRGTLREKLEAAGALDSGSMREAPAAPGAAH
ncbi:hypothetical protein EMIHUDRAFT_197665 [Emiliania huxleyi CCMP1516]|uniref:Glutaredoxin domain-containing protein n=2 Tax=Emiliania huxleyi TaxID=2903 RepID=A0A0D3IUN2_EMIH1|nr:hypothetical protein EMIHUDRAFT_197665 [Emiliania huxleyi CCMP1516]EOD14967.1 hypothetical protein EMIHUDRAFT_197665 [Emiliania huxleyi CCMP1516]|eukprot:XP_005767396.1 hypothetical protein EMIHUDRAFT_197665 [Emiliania huxleyi CCMP1516]